MKNSIECCGRLLVSLNKKNAGKFDAIQRRCHRIVCGNNCNCDLFPSLTERRISQSLKLFNALRFGDHILHYMSPDFSSVTGRLIVPFSRSERRMSFFIIACILILNNLRM